ncbi:MAG: T9SS type A sorting domain-containing protein [Saprospiraceae bacterium]
MFTALLGSHGVFAQCFTCDNIIDVVGASNSGNVSSGCVPNPAGANFGCQGYRIDATTTPALIPGATIYFTTGNGGSCSTGGMSSVYVEVDGVCSPGEVSTTGKYSGSFNIPGAASEVIIYVCRSTGGGNPNLCLLTYCTFDLTGTTATVESCTGANDGTITATATIQGAPLVGTITYSIDGVGGSTANTTGIFTGLAPGDYTVTAYDDANTGCFGTTDVTIAASATPCCTQSVACNNLLDVDLEGCTADIPTAETDPIAIFNYEACGATVTMSSDDQGDLDLCGDNDGIDFIRTYTLYFDNAAQATTCSHRIQVNDTTEPVFPDCPNTAIELGCNPTPPTLNTAAAAAGDPTDACVNPTVFGLGDPVVSNGCQMSRTFNVRATDQCSNIGLCVVTFNWTEDAQPPSIVDISNYSLTGCNPAWPTTLSTTWTDNCTGNGSVNATASEPVTNGCTQTRVYTFTVSDGCDNTGIQTTTITRNYDLTKPIFTNVPQNVSVQCNNIPPVVAPTATDNCGMVAITYNGQTKTNGTCPDSYTLTRRWTASDGCNNTRSVSQRISVSDTQKPGFVTWPSNTVISCTDPIPAVGSATATDNCDLSVTITYQGQMIMNTTCQGTYQIMRSWKATDNCGNFTTVAQVIQVQDLQKPVFTSVPGNTTIQCDQAPPSVGFPTASDACSNSVQISYLGQTRANGSCPHNYTLTRTWRAVDLCGNSTTTAQVITVQDTQAPVFTNPPADLTVVCAPNCVPFAVTPNATDNCGTPAVALVETQTSGDCSSGYVVTRTWTATDQCGNPKVHVQTITVLPAAPFAPTGPRAERNPARGINREQGNQLESQNATLKTVYLIPNPTSDWVSIGLSDFKGEAAVVAILNDLGQLVWEKRFDAVAETALRVNLRQQGAAEGVYTVSVRAGGEVYTKRLVLTE